MRKSGSFFPKFGGIDTQVWGVFFANTPSGQNGAVRRGEYRRV